MSTLQNPDNLTSEEEYLKGELQSDIKHEYVDGHVYAMTGAKQWHNLIAGNVFGEIRNHLQSKPCRPFSSDMKVKVGSKYFYPDVLVDRSSDNSNYVYTESPTIIVEVLSQSTRKMDKTVKKMAYMNIPTLQEYVLIEQDFVDIEVYRKSDEWHSTHYFLGDTITLESIELTLTVEEIYERVQNEDMTEWLEDKAS